MNHGSVHMASTLVSNAGFKGAEAGAPAELLIQLSDAHRNCILEGPYTLDAQLMPVSSCSFVDCICLKVTG